MMQGYTPVVLTSSRIRLPLNACRNVSRSLTVLSFNEIVPGIGIESVGMVNES